MPPRTSRLSTARLVALAACSLLLAGCSSAGEEESAQKPANLSLPPKDIENWTMPLDPYKRATLDPAYPAASSALISTCMAQSGYTFPAEPLRTPEDDDPTMNDAGVKVFTASIAATYGYHFAQDVPGTPAQRYEQSRRFQVAPEVDSEQGQAALDACLDTASQKLPSPPVNPLVNHLVGTAQEQAPTQPAVMQAATAWRECMLPLGIPDLTDNPREFPSPSLRAQFPGGGDGEFSAPSAYEIEVATKDFACQESSGYRQALYDAEWDLQAQFLAENIQRLDAERQQFQQINAESQKVLNGS